MGRIKGFPEWIALFSAPRTALYVVSFSLVDLGRDLLNDSLNQRHFTTLELH